MSEHLKKHQFQPLTLSNTRLEFWSERDRLYIGLQDCRGDVEKTLWEVWDEDAYSYFEDGFLDDSCFIMGRLHKKSKLHESVLNYYFYINPDKAPKTTAA